MAIFKENLPIWVPPSPPHPHRETLRILSQLLLLRGKGDKQPMSQGSCDATLSPFLTHQNTILKGALSLSHPFYNWFSVLFILLITSQMEIPVFTADNCFLVCIVLGPFGGL